VSETVVVAGKTGLEVVGLFFVLQPECGSTARDKRIIREAGFTCRILLAGDVSVGGFEFVRVAARP